MAYDLVIRDGTVVDGSGLGSFSPPTSGVVDDRIAFRGEDQGSGGRREIDADGHVVTPGFVDGHTPHGRAGLLGCEREQLVLARRDDCGDG